MLTLADAHFDFGRERILRGASFTAYAGQKCALVGPNGAGKTTLLNILAGEITLQGGSRSLIGGTQLRYLRQETTLEAPAGGAGTVLEAVADAAFARERELEREIHDVAARLAARLMMSRPSTRVRHGTPAVSVSPPGGLPGTRDACGEFRPSRHAGSVAALAAASRVG